MLSKPNNQLLVINCSCLNNSVLLVDPASLSVVDKIFISKTNFKMSRTVSKLIYLMTPKLLECQKDPNSYSKLFKGFLSQNRDGQIGVKIYDFIRCLKQFSGLVGIESDEW